MEKEINIAAILKDKPYNSKLYDVARDINVFYGCQVGNDCEIHCYPKEGGFLPYHYNGTLIGFPKGMQILKPSKEMQDWSKFAWKKGDVLKVISGNSGCSCIFDRFTNDDYTEFTGVFDKYLDRFDYFATSDWCKVTDEKEYESIIQRIETQYGGKLNLGTLRIEKPQFKDGDIVAIEPDETHKEVIAIIKEDVIGRGIKTYCHKYGDEFIAYDLNIKPSNDNVRLATDSEKQQLFAALKKANKAWDADKKAIVDLPKKCEFKPMDWCLMRRGSIDTWHLCQYSDTCADGYYAVGGNFFKDCIPYNDQTAHLLGTTDDWKGGEE